ncbi:hypothetical protein AAVH_20151 [Aphelenchoides avenae]|nr:hypothetical protein AAVH_20151 [Aphelenchus avenae]
MASTLSLSAIHRIIFLVEYDDSSTRKRKKAIVVHKLYSDIKPAPPLAYLNSFELALVLKGEVADADACFIFAHGKPMEFWGCPRLLVSKIVEAFTALHDEPTYLNVTITALHDFGTMCPSEAWSQIYSTHLPCNACTTVETAEGRSIRHLRYS